MIAVETRTIKVPLTQGKVALIDAEDLPEVQGYKWFAHRNEHTYYAETNLNQGHGKYRSLGMHRVIGGLDFGDLRQIDHINGNGLDNRRKNLRIATPLENQQNQRPIRGGTSRFKGVSWHQRSQHWQVQIGINRRRIHLGLFDNETEAALAYNEAAKRYFGEFARLNEIPEVQYGN